MAIQYTVSLPIIGERSDQILEGVMAQNPSSLHWAYVLVELIKVGNPAPQASGKR